MANDFYANFSITDSVKDTMDRQYINDNTLRASSAGTSVVNPVGSQWWASTTNSFLYIRNIGNTAWLPVYNIDAQAVYIKSQQITSGLISDDARKGSIVEGEAIAPSSCTIQCGGGEPADSGATLPFILDPHRAYTSGSSGPPVLIPFLNTLVWVHESAGFIKAKAEMSTTKASGIASFRFRVGVVNSSIIDVTGSSPTWAGAEAICDVSALTGWQPMSFYLSTNLGYLAPATLHGCVMRWD